MSRPFFVAFVGRSGSTALMLDLGRHPQIDAQLEIFGAEVLHRGLPPTDENRLALMRVLWDGYLPRAPKPERERAIGFKFQFKRGQPQFGDLDALAAAVKPYHPVVIALWRRDLLRQVISTLRARALEQINEREMGVLIPHIVAESGPEARAYAERPMRVDIAELGAELEEVQRNIADMRAFLTRLPANLMISYEAYAANRAGVLNRITQALDVAPFDEAPPATLSKITGSDLSRAISNWDEVAAFAAERGLELAPEGARRERGQEAGAAQAEGERSPEVRRLRRSLAESRRRIATLEDEHKALTDEKRMLKKRVTAAIQARLTPADVAEGEGS